MLRDTAMKPWLFLKTKKKGNYCVLQIDADYKPQPVESKEVYGVTFEQERNEAKITADC